MNTNDTSKANPFEVMSFISPSPSTDRSRSRSKRKQNLAIALDLSRILLCQTYISYKEHFDDNVVDSDDNNKFDVDNEYVEDEVNKNIEDWCTLTAEERRSWSQASAMKNDTTISSINHSLYLSKSTDTEPMHTKSFFVLTTSKDKKNSHTTPGNLSIMALLLIHFELKSTQH